LQFLFIQAALQFRSLHHGLARSKSNFLNFIVFIRISRTAMSAGLVWGDVAEITDEASLQGSQPHPLFFDQSIFSATSFLP
jgi:hypothetical protein